MGLVHCHGSRTTVGISAADIGRGTRVCPECGQQSKFGSYNALRMTSKLAPHTRPSVKAKSEKRTDTTDTRRRRPSALAELLLA
jgi:hypothetical protein